MVRLEDVKLVSDNRYYTKSKKDAIKNFGERNVKNRKIILIGDGRDIVK